MTTDNTDMTSAIDQDQAQLDAVQEATPQTNSDSMTGEIQALKELVEQQNRQVAGLQSKIDRGLNSMRSEYEYRARLQAQEQAQQYIQEIPEEHQGAFNSMLQANNAYYQENQRLKEQVIGGTEEPPQFDDQTQQQWEQVYAIPRGLGIDPNTPGIDYDAFTDQGLTEDQRRDRFFSSLKTVMGATNQAPGAQATGESTSQVQSPPTSGTPAGGVSSNMRSVEQVQTAYIEGKLSKQEYKDQLNRLG